LFPQPDTAWLVPAVDKLVTGRLSAERGIRVGESQPILLSRCRGDRSSECPQRRCLHAPELQAVLVPLFANGHRQASVAAKLPVHANHALSAQPEKSSTGTRRSPLASGYARPYAGAGGRLESGMRVMAKPSEMERLARKNSRRARASKSNTKCAPAPRHREERRARGKVKIHKQAVAVGRSKARMLSK